MTSLEQARKIVQVMDSKRQRTSDSSKSKGFPVWGDYFVVASASNTTQVKAIADEVEDEMTKLGLEPNRVEGRQSAQWILMDYYDVMVHVFLDEARSFYNLERLWSDAPQLDISDLLTQN